MPKVTLQDVVPLRRRSSRSWRRSWRKCPCKRPSSWHAARAHLASTVARLQLKGGASGGRRARAAPGVTLRRGSPPAQGCIKYWGGLRRCSRGRPCHQAPPVPAVIRRVRGGASDSVLRHGGGFSCITETGTQCKLCQNPLRSHRCSYWTGWDTRCCTTTGAWV